VLVKFHIAVVVSVLSAGIAAVSAQPAVSDPVLQGPAPPFACAEALDGPDYVPGLDANGQAVPRADIGAGRVPVPGELLLPLPNRPAFGRGARGGRGRSGGDEPAYLVLDGQRVERLVNPGPACPPGQR
jgi:hypothetical protein